MGEPGARAVLVVEDDASLRRLVERLLERENAPFTSAPNTDEAVRLLDEGLECGLWLVDATVAPSGAGVLLDRAAVCEPQPRVVVMSGDRLQAPLVERLEAIDGTFLPKPFAPTDIRRMVEELWPGAVPEASEGA